MVELVRSIPLEDQWLFVAVMSFVMMFLAALCLVVSDRRECCQDMLRTTAHTLTVTVIVFNLMFSKAVTDQCEYVVQAKTIPGIKVDRQPESDPEKTIITSRF